MACMKMLGLAVLASAKGASPNGEKQPANTALLPASGGAKRPRTAG